MLYNAIFSLVFKRMDPEVAHELAFRAIETYGKVPVLRKLGLGLIAPYRPTAGTKVFGRTVVAPFGLAAGFDKNARAAVGLAHIGFGFVEVGTITALAQPGNESRVCGARSRSSRCETAWDLITRAPRSSPGASSACGGRGWDARWCSASTSASRR